MPGSTHVSRSAASPQPCCQCKQGRVLRRPALSRRSAGAALLTGALGLLLQQAPAYAGWDGPAKFLKSRQQANAGMLLAPVKVSLAKLQALQKLLEDSAGSPTPALYDKALQTVRKASCNCYQFTPFEDDPIETKVSLLTADLKIADPCTFRILVRNLTLLLEDNDPLRLRCYDTLQDLIKSYSRLDDALLDYWSDDTRAQIVPLLSQTIELQSTLRDALADSLSMPA